MNKKNEKTLKYVGIGVVGLFLLSKLNMSDKVGEGLGDVLGGALGGLGDTLKGAVEGAGAGLGNLTGDVISGAGWGLANVGTGILSPFVDLVGGAGTGATMATEGQNVIKKEGLGVVFWSRDRINEYVSPSTDPVIAATGYKTATGRTNLSERGQVAAVTLNNIRTQHPGWNNLEVAYAYAVETGQDVSGWKNKSLLTSPSFLAEYTVN